ncbi:MAG TPA: hypothetical protein VMT24_01035, partial [Aggregatilineaceae bacterium]|nr:hypothetical protein [Aggregatilineaceae bacterium]
IINEDQGAWFAGQIRAFDLTPHTVDVLLARENLPVRERALQTIVKNRVNRGGILAAGAGKVRWGENGKGIASRWYPDTLANRILDIVAIRDQLSFVHGDGLHVIRQNSYRQDIAFFIDPPYTAAGKKPGSRLYTCSDLDHNMLFELVSQAAGDFLMTYDDVEDIRRLASQWEFETQSVAMKNTHHARKTELLIGRDLGWLR